VGTDLALLFLSYEDQQEFAEVEAGAGEHKILRVVAQRYQVVGLLFGELGSGDDVLNCEVEEVNDVDAAGECDYQFAEPYFGCEHVGIEVDVADDVVEVWVGVWVLSSKMATRLAGKVVF
jgi:hypothetical protein